MKLIEWEVTEDSYQEQINIPKEIRAQALEEGISTEVKQKMLQGSGRIRIRIL